MLIIVIASPAPSTIEAEPSPPRQRRPLVRPGLAPRSAPFQDRNENEELRKAFLGLKFCEAGDEQTIPTPHANVSPSEDYTEVFLSHARVYVFAEKFNIRPLKRLALTILHKTLSVFNFFPECVDDIAALIRFAYNETLKPAKGVEPMRNMLKLYMDIEIFLMSTSADFRDALYENKDLLDDYCSCVRRKPNRQM